MVVIVRLTDIHTDDMPKVRPKTDTSLALVNKSEYFPIITNKFIPKLVNKLILPLFLWSLYITVKLRDDFELTYFLSTPDQNRNATTFNLKNAQQ